VIFQNNVFNFNNIVGRVKQDQKFIITIHCQAYISAVYKPSNNKIIIIIISIVQLSIPVSLD
jgi:hypothetical protein